MFEEQTYEAILDRMLDRGSDLIDKREGSVFYDAVAPASLEIAQAYWELENVMNEGFADTASYEYLARRAAERYIYPHEATFAIVKARFAPENIEIPDGTRFNLGEFNYIVMNRLSEGFYRMQCETAGSQPNGSLGELTPIDYIDGLAYGEITEVLILGENEETVDEFRKRYLESFDDQPANGNIAWYKQTLTDLQGVGGVKVLRAWNGPGTVKCIIQNSEYGIPSEELLGKVQTQIDPEVNHGEGIGLAPIGHTVTIAGVTGETLNITSTFTLEVGTQWEDVKTSLEKLVDDYFKELNTDWENLDNIVVRISQMETRFLGVVGVVDVENTLINGTASNFVVSSEKIPVRGSVLNG